MFKIIIVSPKFSKPTTNLYLLFHDLAYPQVSSPFTIHHSPFTIHHSPFTKLTPSTPFILRLSHSLISIGLILLLMYLAQNILVPLAFASLLCILLMAPCDFLEKHRFPKGLAALLSVLAAIIIVGIVFYFISKQMIGFRDDLPKVARQLYAGIQDLQLWAQKKFHISDHVMNDYLNTATSETLAHTTSLVGSTFSTLSSTLVYVVLIPIYTFLLLLYRKMVISFFTKSFSAAHTSVVYSVLSKTKAVIRGYIVGLGIEMMIVALMCFIGFTLLGVEYALLLAVVTAVLNLIPYLGIFTAALFSMLITFATGGGGITIGTGIVMFVIHLIDSNFLLPKVVGSKVKINALVTLLAVLVGNALWGFSGMFLSIPIVAILKVIFDSVEHLSAWGFILGDEIVVNKPANLMALKKNWPRPKFGGKNQQARGSGPIVVSSGQSVTAERPATVDTSKPLE